MAAFGWLCTIWFQALRIVSGVRPPEMGTTFQPSFAAACCRGLTRMAHCGTPQTTKSIVLCFGMGLVILTVTGILVGRFSSALSRACAFGIDLCGTSI